ncbi:MAG: LysM peptidoglycan-binding domain-containing protein [Candidatus Limnocylindria bacterium]
MQRPRLLVPLTGLAVTLVAGPILATVALAADPLVTVRSGDTLTSISKRHDVDIPTLVNLNDLANPNRIYAGQLLRVATEPPPAAAPPPAPTAAAPRVHTVTAGQNLTTIARQYGVSIAAIVQANGIINASRIYAGQRITIPGAATASAPAPAASGMPASMASLVAKRDAVRRIIVEEADRSGVPAAFALAVAWQESGWQQAVVSSAGAVGVMQLMPDTADWIGEVMLGSAVNSSDTRSNVRAGVRLLAHYLDRYDGDRDRVLAAYYQGQWATDHHGIYSVSRPYIASIKVLERVFSGG